MLLPTNPRADSRTHRSLCKCRRLDHPQFCPEMQPLCCNTPLLETEAPRSTPQQEPLSLAMVSTVVGDDSDAGQPDLVTDGYRWESVRWEDGMQSHQCPLYNFAGADEASGSAIVHVHNSSNGAVVGNRQFECRSRGLSSLRTMDSSQVARRRDRNNFPRQFGQGAKKLLCLLACCSYRPAVRPAQNQGPRAANP